MYSVILCLAMLSKQGEASSSNYGSGSQQNEDSNSLPNYKFQYGVYDSKTSNDFGHEEERNGQETKGQYKVQLPDGRLQIVTYVADQNGYRADVTYQQSSSNGNNYAAAAAPATSSGSGSGSGAGGYAGSSGSGSGQGNQQPRNTRSFSTLKTKINGQYYGY